MSHVNTNDDHSEKSGYFCAPTPRVTAYPIPRLTPAYPTDEQARREDAFNRTLDGNRNHTSDRVAHSATPEAITQPSSFQPSPLTQALSLSACTQLGVSPKISGAPTSPGLQRFHAYWNVNIWAMEQRMKTQTTTAPILQEDVQPTRRSVFSLPEQAPQPRESMNKDQSISDTSSDYIEDVTKDFAFTFKLDYPKSTRIGHSDAYSETESNVTGGDYESIGVLSGKQDSDDAAYTDGNSEGDVNDVAAEHILLPNIIAGSTLPTLYQVMDDSNLGKNLTFLFKTVGPAVIVREGIYTGFSFAPHSVWNTWRENTESTGSASLSARSMSPTNSDGEGWETDSQGDGGDISSSGEERGVYDTGFSEEHYGFSDEEDGQPYEQSEYSRMRDLAPYEHPVESIAHPSDDDEGYFPSGDDSDAGADRESLKNAGADEEPYGEELSLVELRIAERALQDGECSLSTPRRPRKQPRKRVIDPNDLLTSSPRLDSVPDSCVFLSTP